MKHKQVRKDDPSKAGKSKYADKVRRKCGNGTVDPRWMWWLEGATPRRLAAVVGALALLVCGTAQAETKKAPKPSVCLSYQLGADKAGNPFAICYDSEKPALFTRFAEVVVLGKEAGSAKVLVGWR